MVIKTSPPHTIDPHSSILLISPLPPLPQVKDLRQGLQTLGLPAEGNRFEMMERMQDYLDSRRTDAMVSGAESAEDLRRQVCVCGGGYWGGSGDRYVWGGSRWGGQGGGALADTAAGVEMGGGFAAWF